MPAKPSSKPILTLTIPGRLPSWNQILAMHHWQRKKFKDQIAKDFLRALQATESGSLTKATSVTSSTRIYADTLARCLTTRRKSAIAKSGKSSARKAILKELWSK
jgi:hypothetical protein